MKIAIFHNMPPGGAKRVLYEEAKGLASRKHDLYLFELDLVDRDFLDIRPFCKKVYRYSFRAESKLPGFLSRLERDYKNFFSLLRLQKKISYQINYGNFDICLVHPDKFTQAPFILRFLRIPSIYFCEELLRIVYEKELKFVNTNNILKNDYEYLTRLLRKRIDLINARSASKILTNSCYVKKKAGKIYKVNTDVCYLGVDPEVFIPDRSEKRNQILFIGGKDKINGYDLFSQMRELVKKKVSINFRNITFSKSFSDKELSKEYSKSILTLCTSYNEPFGLVALESMSCETPVLAVNEGGYRETILDGITGFLLRRNREEFLRKILYLIRHPDISKKMGMRARKHVCKNWTWANHLDKLEKSIEEII
ncbi:MAG: glycosyltransferase family 4 protein [Candidatus Pacebacteria bacterium]|nr:glycosyltransferase family 4 protein [Candidatus Paceibacterota bacterium]